MNDNMCDLPDKYHANTATISTGPSLEIQVGDDFIATVEAVGRSWMVVGDRLMGCRSFRQGGVDHRRLVDHYCRRLFCMPHCKHHRHVTQGGGTRTLSIYYLLILFINNRESYLPL